MIEALYNAELSLYPKSGVAAPDGTEDHLACSGTYPCYFDQDGKTARSLGNVGDLEAADGYAIVEQAVKVRIGDRVHVAYTVLRKPDQSLDTSFDFDGLVTGTNPILSGLAAVTIISVKRC